MNTNQTTTPTDRFGALCREMDEAGATLPPEQITVANTDPIVRAAGLVRNLLESMRNDMFQDHLTHLAKTQSRSLAVRELIEGQGKSPAEAEGIISSYQGPIPTHPAPDPVTVQPDDAQAETLQAGIERLQALAVAPVKHHQPITAVAIQGRTFDAPGAQRPASADTTAIEV